MRRHAAGSHRDDRDDGTRFGLIAPKRQSISQFQLAPLYANAIKLIFSILREDKVLLSPHESLFFFNLKNQQRVLF